ncbi:MAG: hypothetical protein Q4E33_00885 [Erysipelotrichaceae bacterium]|nr:hypothetical protein [Erysipelotrichaceae bacterium]
MKKIVILLICLLALTACNNKASYSKVSDEDEVIFSGPGTTYTKGDLYAVLKLTSSTTINNELINYIANKENINPDDYKAEAEEYTQLMVDYGLEETIISYYGSLDAFTKMYQDDLVQFQIVKNYVSDHYDEYVTVDKPVKIQNVYFDNEEAAKKMIEDVNSGKDFATAAAENGYEADCSEFIALDSDDLLLEVKEYINSATQTGISSIIESSTTSADDEGNEIEVKQYNIVNIVDNDVNNYKEDYISVKAETITLDSIKDELFSKLNIEYFDQDLYDLMTTEE